MPEPQIAAMNVAICEALGIDPTGITKLMVILDKDQIPRIEVTYSARYIAGLTESMDDGTKIAEHWCYELRPITELELAAPANGSDWVDVTELGEEYRRYYQPTTPSPLTNATPTGVADGGHPRPEKMGDGG